MMRYGLFIARCVLAGVVPVLLLVVALPATAEPGTFLSRGPVDPLAVSRGPVELRDEWMLAQPRLTLPVATPDALACGRSEFVFHAVWGNDFGFSQEGPAENPLSDRRFLVDGEHRTFAFQFRHGLGHGVDVSLRLPIQWRGAGILDPLIDWFHENTGTMNNARDEFDQNRYRVQGRDRAGHTFDWDDEHGTGLGNAEVSVRWAFLKPRHPRGLRLAAIARAGLPTGTGPFETGSFDLGMQLVAAKRLHRRWDVYGGVGGSWYSDDEIRGFEYEPWRGYGFLAVEFRVFRAWSLLLQTDASTRLISNVEDYPATQWYLSAGAKADLGRQTRLVLGFTENLVDQQSTMDISGWVGIEKRF